MGANSLQPTHARSPETNKRPKDDSWVDRTADRVAEVLREEGLDMELVVFFDPITHVAPYCSSGTLPGTSSSPSGSVDSASSIPLPTRR
jgi:hypothetical protein